MRHLSLKLIISETVCKIPPSSYILRRFSLSLRPLSLSASSSLYQTLQTRKLLHTLSRNAHDHITSSSLFPQAHFLFLQSSCFCTAFQMFDKMPHRNQHLQDAHFYSVSELLNSSISRPADIVTAVSLHCLALKIGAVSHLPICTCLLTLYSKLRDLNSSWALFEDIQYRDVIIYNAMITAFFHCEFFKEAMNLFLHMINDGSRFDSTTLLLAVSAFSQMGCFRHGQVIHSLGLKAGVLLNSSLCNAIVNMYSKCGDLNSSECMFLDMECSRDNISWNSIMTACLRNNHPENSLLYFREMFLSDERADHVSLSCAIAACACLGDVIFGRLIHGLGIKLGYSGSFCISVSNSLISLYSHYGEIENAETVFREMEYKDVISWNSMIEGFASNGDIFIAFSILHDMQCMDFIPPDKVTLVTIIPLCAEFMLLKEGKSIHGFAIRRWMGTDLLVKNSLINMYSKCSSLTKAELLFDSIWERDLVSWNTMISGYSHNGLSTKAQNLFREVLKCSQCSLSTVSAIFSSCNSPESLHFGKSVHCWHFKLGFSYNTLALNFLICMYVNCGDLMAAFSSLCTAANIADYSCWNALISGCTRNEKFQKALETFKIMRRESNINYDSITIVSIISACGNLSWVSQGKSIHGLTLKTLIGSETRVQNSLITMYGRFGDIDSASLVFDFFYDRNLCSWNCMISAFSQNKDSKRALELFRCLEFEPNEITIASILSARTHLGGLIFGKQIHGRVFRFNLENNSIISAALIDFYSNCGRLDIAIQVFKNSGEKSVETWNSVISAYAHHGKGRKAMKTFREMCNSGIKSTKSTFTSLLSACSHSGLVDEGLWYYKHMLTEYGVEPFTEHYVWIVEMLGRAGRFDQAYEFIETLRTPPESGVWGALLSTCNYYGNLEMGRKVAEILFELEPKNVGYYISLSNMYVGAGMWKQAVESRETIQDQGLRKPAGYSLLDTS